LEPKVEMVEGVLKLQPGMQTSFRLLWSCY